MGKIYKGLNQWGIWEEIVKKSARAARAREVTRLKVIQTWAGAYIESSLSEKYFCPIKAVSSSDNTI